MRQMSACGVVNAGVAAVFCILQKCVLELPLVPLYQSILYRLLAVPMLEGHACLARPQNQGMKSSAACPQSRCLFIVKLLTGENKLVF